MVMEKQVVPGGFMPPLSGGKVKVQTVMVSIPPQVKQLLLLMANFNSATWVLMGITLWFSDDPTDLPTWGIVLLSVAIFCCVILIPLAIRFINNVPWGQKE